MGFYDTTFFGEVCHLHPLGAGGGGREEQEAGRCQAGCQGQPVVSPHVIASFHLRGIYAFQSVIALYDTTFFVELCLLHPLGAGGGGGEEQEAGCCQAGCQSQPVVSPHEVAAFHRRRISPMVSKSWSSRGKAATSTAALAASSTA